MLTFSLRDPIKASILSAERALLSIWASYTMALLLRRICLLLSFANTALASTLPYPNDIKQQETNDCEAGFRVRTVLVGNDSGDPATSMYSAEQLGTSDPVRELHSDSHAASS